MNRTYTYFAGILLSAICLLLGSCERRELTYPNNPGQLAIIPIHIDWSESRLEQNKDSRASVWLFPKDGRQPIENHFQGNITDIEVKAPVGEYAILIFNETVADSRWKGIMEFRGTGRYETFGAYLLENNSALAKVRSEGSPYHHTALALAAWSLDDFVVTQNMIDVTRTRASLQTRAGEPLTKAEETKVDQMLSRLTMVKPQPMVRSVFVKAKVYNLNSAYGATAKFSGVTEGILLSSGQLIPSPVCHLLTMNNRQMEENGKDGTVENRFLTFGLLHETEQIVVNLSFQMWDTKWYDDPRPFDVTNTTSGTGDYEIELHIGQPAPGQPEEEDHPVLLPVSDVAVGEWEEKFIDIK